MLDGHCKLIYYFNAGASKPNTFCCCCKNFCWLTNSAIDLLTSQVGQSLKANEPRQREANLKETFNLKFLEDDLRGSWLQTELPEVTVLKSEDYPPFKK